MTDIRGYDVNHINKLEAENERLRAENKELRRPMPPVENLKLFKEQLGRIAELESALQGMAYQIRQFSRSAKLKAHQRQRLREIAKPQALKEE